MGLILVLIERSMRKIQKLNFQQSKHLLERTGFGVELDEVESFVGLSVETVVQKLISQSQESNVPPPKLLKPSERQQKIKQLRKSGQRREANKLVGKERKSLKEWGLKNLLESENKLHERMVWFWHNHFTSSTQNVSTMAWMFQQDESIRKHAMGNFSELLIAMTFDPAMLIYLDGKSNRKGQPNENFARELLELFTLGEGHYTEGDIKEAARAFTGWKVNTKKDKVIFRKKHHDSGIKNFMGQQGNFSADDILKIVLQNPRTAEFISEKLWYEFVSIQPPDPAVIKSWASSFITSHYDITKLLEVIFKSDAFWDEKYRGTLIKSPLDIVVGSLRTFNLEDQNASLNVFVRQLKLMGQDLYSPPNVKGWEGGKAWIDDDSLLRRRSFLTRIMRGQAGANKKKRRKMSAMKMTDASMSESRPNKNMKSGMKKNAMDLSKYKLPDLSEKQWVEWLLPINAITPIDKKSKQARLKAIVLDPAYQLK